MGSLLGFEMGFDPYIRRAISGGLLMPIVESFVAEDYTANFVCSMKWWQIGNEMKKCLKEMKERKQLNKDWTNIGGYNDMDNR